MAVRVQVGDAVATGQRLAALEAVNMEHRLFARHDGVVERSAVRAGDHVAPQVETWEAPGRFPVALYRHAAAIGPPGMARCASEAVRMHGGAGFIRGVQVGRIDEEVEVNAIGGGVEEVMRARQPGSHR